MSHDLWVMNDELLISMVKLYELWVVAMIHESRFTSMGYGLWVMVMGYVLLPILYYDGNTLSYNIISYT
jgi:hypothetical protein